MSVIVVRDVTHVVIERPPARSEHFVGHLGEGGDEAFLHLLRGRSVVRSPHHHGHEADFAISNPAKVVLKVARRDDRTFTKIAAVAHFTCKRTDESFATIVPAAGASETTLVQVGVGPAPGPVVE